MVDSRLFAILVIGIFAVSCRGGSGGGASNAAPADHAAKVQAWRDKHEADYRRDWVSIAGLHFLMTGTYTVGSGQGNDIVLAAHVPATIGRLVVADGKVTYEPASGVAVMQQGKPVAGSIVLKEQSSPPKDEIVIGDVRLVVHVSGERLSLRVRDPHGELATGFLGFTWFPIQPEYRVVGRFVPDAEPRQMSVLNTFNDVDTYPTEGVVEFQLNGQMLRLRPFTTRPKRFYFVFRDASSGQETYETARFLYADLLDDGTTVLDFNEAYNPPCAFNPYTTCPIPLRENILPVKILAGEKAYPVEVKLPSEKS
ncbi:MAG TPA: DUF1684 domain-containing protein [Vicinamibacterales bacterium]|jgi:uncharacterized protein (DUF1684 family)